MFKALVFSLLGYPEIMVAIASFFLLHYLKCKDHVVVNWPILGMLPDVFLNIHRLHEWTYDVLRATPGWTLEYTGTWSTPMQGILTCDPANVNYILTTNFSNFPKGQYFTEMFDILGQGIFNSDSDMWMAQRRMAHARFSNQRFKRFTARTVREMVEKSLIPVLDHVVQHDMVVDLQDLLQRFGFDTACILVLGNDPGCLSINYPAIPFARALEDAEEAILFRTILPTSWWKLLRWLGIGKEKKLAKARKIVDSFIAQCISNRSEELRKREGLIQEEPNEDTDLLTSYMNCEREGSTGGLRSDKFLRDTTLSLLFAGRDTVGVALTWFYWVLSKNPRVEAKILEELREKLVGKEEEGGGCSEKPMVFDVEKLDGLVYLHAALCESLRLFPPIPFEIKTVLHSDVLPSGTKVRRGMRITVSIYAMARMEGVWGKDCMEFKPERWISEKGNLKFERTKFVVFNSGPRTCLGKEMALIQMKAVAATMIYNYHVKVIDGHPVVPRFSVILQAKNGLMVRLKKRRAG